MFFRRSRQSFNSRFKSRNFKKMNGDKENPEVPTKQTFEKEVRDSLLFA